MLNDSTGQCSSSRRPRLVALHSMPFAGESGDARATFSKRCAAYGQTCFGSMESRRVRRRIRGESLAHQAARPTTCASRPDVQHERFDLSIAPTETAGSRATRLDALTRIDAIAARRGKTGF